MMKLIARILLLSAIILATGCANEKKANTEETKSSTEQESKPNDAQTVDDEDEMKEKSEEEQKAKESTEGSDEMSVKASKEPQQAAETSAEADKLTTLTLEEKFFDFGKHKEGEQLLHTFVFKNTGNAPLKLQTVKTSCNCSHLKWTKNKTYAPGDTGHINLRFDSKDKSGTQQKSFDIIANTEPKRTVIRFSAEIEK
jgi:hypothetical protein